MVRTCKVCGNELNETQTKYCSRTCAIKGVGPTPVHVPDEVYLDDVKQVKEILGHYPSYGEYMINGGYHPATLWRRFGPWTRTLELAGYVPPPPDWTIDQISDEDGGWLAGIFAGEGMFRLSKLMDKKYRLARYHPHIAVSQREDNYLLIEEIIRLWHLDKKAYRIIWRGKSYYKNNFREVRRNPTIQLAINDVPTIVSRAIPTFDKYPLRTTKQDEFLVFKKAIGLLAERREKHRFNRPYTNQERSELDKLFLELKNLKEYQNKEYLFSFEVNTYTGNY